MKKALIIVSVLIPLILLFTYVALNIKIINPDVKQPVQQNSLIDKRIIVGDNIKYEGEICNLFTEKEAGSLLKSKNIDKYTNGDDECSYILNKPLRGIIFRIRDISDVGVSSYVQTLQLTTENDLKEVDIAEVDSTYWVDPALSLYAIKGQSVIIITTVRLEDNIEDQRKLSIKVLNKVLSRLSE